MKLLATPIGRLRLLALTEGVSFLILLGVAMPLKYMAGVAAAVKVVGWAHGLLFMAFCIALIIVMREARWSVIKAGVVFLAALIPFGPFLIDGQLAREDEAA